MLADLQVISNLEVGQRVKTRRLFVVLLSEPYFVASEKVKVKEIRFVGSKDHLARVLPARTQEELQQPPDEKGMHRAIDLIDKIDPALFLHLMERGQNSKK